jgi:hypothetical protein
MDQPARERLERDVTFSTRRLGGGRFCDVAGFRPRPIFFASDERTFA